MFGRMKSRGGAFRGFTLIEMAVSLGIFSSALMFVGFLTLFQAREAKTVHLSNKADKNSHELMEFIRYKVVKGQFGTLQITDNGRTLQFVDPTISESASQFRLLNGTLYYDNDVSQSPS